VIGAEKYNSGMGVRAFKRLTKEQAYEVFKANPDFIKNRSAAARAWGVERGTIRNWEREWNKPATDTPPSPEPLPQTPPPVAPTLPQALPATPGALPASNAPTATVNALAMPSATGPTKGVRICLSVAALSLATVSAGLSITGMTHIFVGSQVPVIGLGIAFECGKLSGVAWLGQAELSALKKAIAALIGALMILNSIGVYGFLAQAHIEHALSGSLATAARAADVEGRLEVQAKVVADLDRRIAQIDGAVEQATARGRTNNAMALAQDQRKIRADLASQRVHAAKVLATLQNEKAASVAERRKADADLGPLKYLAALLGADDEEVLRWFILGVALLLDPAGVLLLLASTRR